MHGDGEEVFPKLVAALLNQRTDAILELPGVVLRVGERYVGSSTWEPLDICRTPIPRWDLTLTKDFNDFAPQRSPLLPMVFIEETRGCMYRCAFCSYPQEIPHRLKSPERIVQEISQYLTWGFRHYNFYSAVFTSPPAHCRKILEWLISRDLGVTFSCQARISDLQRNPDLIGLLAKAGCVHMSVGIESADPSLLQRMGKTMDGSRVHEILRLVQDAGITVCPNLFIGFPGETNDTIDATYDFVRTGNFPTLYLSSFVVERASEVFRRRDHYGLEVSDDGCFWSHKTMNSLEAERETARFFIRFAQTIPSAPFSGWTGGVSCVSSKHT